MTQVANPPAGVEVVGPTAEPCPGEMYTDSQGMHRLSGIGRLIGMSASQQLKVSWKDVPTQTVFQFHADFVLKALAFLSRRPADSLFVGARQL